MTQNPAKLLKIFIYIFSLLNIITFIIVFNLSNLDAIQYKENSITVETGIKSELWAYSIIISLMIFLANIFYDLKSLSDSRRYHDTLRIIILMISCFIIFGFAFIIPYHEIIILNNSSRRTIIQQHFILRGKSKHEIRFEDIDHIKYILQYFYIRNPKAQNYISSIRFALTDGREIQVSSSSHDILSINLRETLVQEIAQATGKKIVIIRRRAN